MPALDSYQQINVSIVRKTPLHWHWLWSVCDMWCCVGESGGGELFPGARRGAAAWRLCERDSQPRRWEV